MPKTSEEDTAQKYAQYKGKTYRLAWQGQTKFGERAKLMFLDGSKEFWVAAGTIKDAPAPTGIRHGSPHGRFNQWGHCWECGCEGWLDDDGYCGC